MIRRPLLVLAALFATAISLQAASPAENSVKKPDEWFRSEEGRTKMQHILSWQTKHGDWPKNTDTTRKKYSRDRETLKGTFDNGASLGELRVLARAFRVTGEERYQAAVLLGFDHVLEAQYPNGGWPQYYPLSKGYHRHITFNDDSMIRIMGFLRDTATSNDFLFLGDDRRTAAAKAVNRGIDCIVKCQVIVDGKPTVWCAQHDEVTLTPVSGRVYELASLSGAESAGILKFLISLKSPDPEVMEAVRNGVAWFESVRIEGFRYKRSATQRNLIADGSARLLWARFYEIDTNRPFFCDREGVVKYDVEQIDPERRSGYAWYGTWGEGVLKAFAEWPHR